MDDFSARELSNVGFDQFQLEHFNGQKWISVGLTVSVTNEVGNQNGPNAVLWFGMPIDAEMSVQDAERAAVERGLLLLKRLSHETTETLVKRLRQPRKYEPGDNA